METDQDIQDPWKVQATAITKYSELLQNATLPDSFERVFKLTEPSPDHKISIAALDKIIRSAGLPKTTTNKILYNILGLNQTHINKDELFVILGMIALAQKNMDATLENFELYKNDLPEPLLPGLEAVDFRSLKGSSQGNQTGFSDPWRLSKPLLSGIEVGSGELSKDAASSIGRRRGSKYKSIINASDLPETPDDKVEIVEAEELGGFLFKYVNYTITSEARACKVLRRYSDFFWLCEILKIRYPYRMFPKLPPKKIGGNKAFFNERRVGLSRFLNFLVVHPVLKEDSLVNAFLTESMEMIHFKRENDIHLFEELEFANLKTNFENIPLSDISIRVGKAQGSVAQATRHHEKMCLALERIRTRQQASGKDYLLYSQALSSLSEQELITPSDGNFSNPQVFSRFDEISNYLQKVSTVMCDGTGLPFEEVIEEFRCHHLLLDSLRDLLQRTPITPNKEIETIKERIAKAQEQLALLEAQPLSPAESERIRLSIESDEAVLLEREGRFTFILQCLWEELDFFHRRLGRTRIIYQRLVSLELDYNTQVSRIWRQLSSVVDFLPHNDDFFGSAPIDSPSSLQPLEPVL